MKNKQFNITFDPNSGNIISIINVNDKHSMNWCAEASQWGRLYCGNIANICENIAQQIHLMTLVRFEENVDEAVSVFTNGRIEVTVKRFFRENGNFVERYIIKNVDYADFFVGPESFGISIPFNDCYTYADDCMRNRCNTHIWCAHNQAYVNALKMGVSDINLGLVLTEGAVHSYSQNETKVAGAHSRGEFILNLDHKEIVKNEEYVIEWELFWHKGNDFCDRADETGKFLKIEAEHFTVFQDEIINFQATIPTDARNVSVLCDDETLKFGFDRNTRILSCSHRPARTGTFRIWISYDDKKTYADFICVSKFDDLVKNRINFIIDNQQYKRKDSPLYGALLAYDNKEEHIVFDDSVFDHNACRERVGMALLIARYLRNNENKKIRDALDLYIAFVKREFYDEETGAVFNTIGKNPNFIRLYNAPWIMTLFAEMYHLTKDSEYLDDIIKMLGNYYSLGGYKFYPNGFSLKTVIEAFKIAERFDDLEWIRCHFEKHVGNMIKNGTSYPKHEVNYEQTIVTPAASMISEYVKLFNAWDYATEAKKHIEVLERFNGHQPSYHMNEIPIRFWDDFWFGKSRQFGDTFPHYWSCLTARSYIDYFDITQDKKYKLAATECIRNCLCLFTDDGRGSCAYVYPYKTWGRRGQFYDEWANDQDFALYFALQMDLFIR